MGDRRGRRRRHKRHKSNYWRRAFFASLEERDCMLAALRGREVLVLEHRTWTGEIDDVQHHAHEVQYHALSAIRYRFDSGFRRVEPDQEVQVAISSHVAMLGREGAAKIIGRELRDAAAKMGVALFGQFVPAIRGVAL